MHLNMNNTSVDDTAAPFISSCTPLQTLELAGTKFSSMYSTRRSNMSQLSVSYPRLQVQGCSPSSMPASGWRSSTSRAAEVSKSGIGGTSSRCVFSQTVTCRHL